MRTAPSTSVFHRCGSSRGWAVVIAACWALLAAPATAFAVMHIEAVSPRIGQQGTTIEVTIQGAFLKGAREVIFYRPGIRATKITELPNVPYRMTLAHGNYIEEQISCQFEIAADCPPGEHPFRVRTATEITTVGTFHVTPFPVIEDTDREAGGPKNDTLETAQAVSPNVSIRGRIANTWPDVDIYHVPAKAGQRLSVEVEAVWIADRHYADSEYDLAIRIRDEEGRVLAANDDNPLHVQDPMVALELPRDGAVFVEVRQSVFNTSPAPYVVHIGTNHRPLAAYPPGGPAGTAQRVRFLGDPLGDYDDTVAIPAETGTFPYFGDAPMPLLLRSSGFPNVLESEAAAETRVEKVPTAVNGIIDRSDDTDAFRLSVKKGDRYRIRVFAATLGSPLDPAIRIRRIDASGKPEAIELEADDAPVTDRDIFGTSFRSVGGLKDLLDPSVIWEPKADGDYLLEVRDRNGSGSPTSVYRIEIEPASDAIFALLPGTGDWNESLRKVGLVVPQGNRFTINVSLPQGQGNRFTGEFDLVARGLPAGVRLVSPRFPAGLPANAEWPVQLVADPATQPTAALITLDAVPADPSRTLRTGSQQNLPFINHSGGDAWRTVRLDRFVMAVTEPSPFSIDIVAPQIPIVRGGELAIPVKLTRQPGFDEPVDFNCDFAPKGVNPQPEATIPSGETEAVLKLSADANAMLGKGPLFIVASFTAPKGDKGNAGQIRVSSAIVELTVAEPFVELASQPESLRRGEKKRFSWTIQQKSPFEGQASVKLLGLPKGVRVVEPLPVITRESKDLAFEIEATDEALLGAVGGLSCELTVLMAGQEIHQRSGKGTLRIDPRR
ncbi:MAG: serine protease [Planctomycetia bacterium]|nr:serine protease [Planctomycetia bacterium]